MRITTATGLLFLYAIFLVAGLPGIMTDYLFYRSDPFSLSVFVLAAALCVLPVLLLAGLAVFWLPGQWSKRVEKWSGLFAAGVILDIFLALGTLYLVQLVNFEPLNKSIKHPLQAIALCALPAAALIYAIRDKDSLVTRTGHVGLFALVLAPLLVGYSILVPEARSTERSPKHLLLLVLDGWPSQYLHAYNPDAPRGPLDEVLETGGVYHGAYTSAAYTSAYFAVLHNGDRTAVEGQRRVFRDRKSLGAALQEQGVGVRFMNYHRNGIPDAGFAHRSDHKGLRSYFLSERYTWIPRALGLEYHVALSGSSMSQNFQWFLPLAVYDWLHSDEEHTGGESNVLTETLMPELRRLRARYSRSFALFHTAWGKVGRGGTPDLPDLPEAQEGLSPSDEMIKRIRASDYRYWPDYEPIAQNVRLRTARSVFAKGKFIRDFIEAVHNDPALADTVIVMTSDHGAMYAKGRYWYGYHPNREVVRVPFFVFDGNNEGRDDPGLFATTELNAAILDYFAQVEAGEGFDPTPPEKVGEPVFSMTLRSDVQKEWFLVATHEDRAFWINLHPQGDGTSHEMLTDGYEQKEISTVPGPPGQLKSQMPALLESFGVNPNQIHSAFQP